MATCAMVDKADVQALGFSASKSAEIIRDAKRLMVSKGFGGESALRVQQDITR